MEAVVLCRVGFLAYSCPKQGQDFKRSAAPLYPNMGQVPPPGVTRKFKDTNINAQYLHKPINLFCSVPSNVGLALTVSTLDSS